MTSLSWKDSKPAKVVYIDSPLLKKEMTVRERNQVFHEIPMDFLATKKSYISVSDILMDKPAEDNLLQWEVCSFTFSLGKTKWNKQTKILLGVVV